MKAKIFCEVTCLNCGTVALGSRFYKNKDTISKLKELTKEWIYDEKFGGNLCPSCQEEIEFQKYALKRLKELPKLNLDD